MSNIDNRVLIDIAAGVLKPKKVKERLFGDVGAALLSQTGDIFTGVCADTPSWGLCAERSAIAAMITAGQYRVEKIVAVCKDERTGTLYVVPPCGICREFMHGVDEGNLDTEVILGLTQSTTLKSLLPLNEWPIPFE